MEGENVLQSAFPFHLTVISSYPQKVDSKGLRPHNNRIGSCGHNLNPHNII